MYVIRASEICIYACVK